MALDRCTVANIVDSASTIVVVWRFDVIPAHVGGLVADLQHPRRQLSICDRRIYMIIARIAFSCGSADLDLVQASVVHIVCKLGV